MREVQNVQHIQSSRKRKTASDTEKIALELSKIIFCNRVETIMEIERTYVHFHKSARHFQRGQCTWRDSKDNPCYCERSSLKFVTYLPDRNYLTRFSVRCQSCYDADTSAVHMYCAYCDEVLTGSIAGPGGKVSDHLTTTRHVYQQALALKDSLECGNADHMALSSAREFVAKLGEWSDKIRYAVRSSIKRGQLDEVLKRLRLLLGRSCTAFQVGTPDASGRVRKSICHPPLKCADIQDKR